MPDSFEAAVQRYQREVFTLACHLLREREEAEDVTQDVLIRWWDRRDQIEDAGLRAWLLKVTRNACFDRLRSRKVRLRLVPVRLDDQEENCHGDPSPGPEAHAEASELRGRIEAALRRLSEPCRSAVILREIHGLEYREIAEVLELPLNTVRVHLHRGRRRIREQLREVHPHAAVN